MSTVLTVPGSRNILGSRIASGFCFVEPSGLTKRQTEIKQSHKQVFNYNIITRAVKWHSPVLWESTHWKRPALVERFGEGRSQDEAVQMLPDRWQEVERPKKTSRFWREQEGALDVPGTEGGMAEAKDNGEKGAKRSRACGAWKKTVGEIKQ